MTAPVRALRRREFHHAGGVPAPRHRQVEWTAWSAVGGGVSNPAGPAVSPPDHLTTTDRSGLAVAARLSWRAAFPPPTSPIIRTATGRALAGPGRQSQGYNCLRRRGPGLAPQTSMSAAIFGYAGVSGGAWSSLLTSPAGLTGTATATHPRLLGDVRQRASISTTTARLPYELIFTAREPAWITRTSSSRSMR